VASAVGVEGRVPLGVNVQKNEANAPAEAVKGAEGAPQAASGQAYLPHVPAASAPSVTTAPPVAK